MQTFSEKDILHRFEFDNPWWPKNNISELPFQNLPRRSYFQPFFEQVIQKEPNRAVVLMGPRRVGKTVLIHHAIQELIKKQNIDPKTILYISLDTPLYNDLSLEKALQLFQKHFGFDNQSELFVFFDEIQYLANWEKHLKSLVDSYPKNKFIASGSAAAALKLKSQESGAGRFSDFLLPPLTFAEYLSFIGKETQLIQVGEEDRQPVYTTNNIKELNQEFIKYINYGGYPEAVYIPSVQNDSQRFIKSDIIDKVLLRDLPSVYGISDIQELNRLFNAVAYNTGQEISLDGLSQSSNVAKNTIKKYLEYLEAAFLIKRIYRIDKNARRFERANYFKVYLTNPSMRSALFGFVAEDSTEMGHLTETAIFSQWFHAGTISRIHYARWPNGEIDIVYLNMSDQKPSWITEVKWSDRPFEELCDLENVYAFYKLHDDISTPLVTTKTKTGLKTFRDIQIDFLPSSLQVYMLGKNIVRDEIASPKKRSSI